MNFIFSVTAQNSWKGGDKIGEEHKSRCPHTYQGIGTTGPAHLHLDACTNSKLNVISTNVNKKFQDVFGLM